MISTRKPEGGESSHTLIPDKNILDSKAERMSHVEYAGRVGGRHHDSERIFLCTIGQIIWIKKSALFPLSIYPRLRRTSVVGLQEFLRHCLLNIANRRIYASHVEAFAFYMASERLPLALSLSKGCGTNSLRCAR